MKNFIFGILASLMLMGCASVPAYYMDTRDKLEELAIEQASQERNIKAIIEIQKILLHQMQKITNKKEVF